MITIEQRLQIIRCLLDVKSAEGLKLSNEEQKIIKNVLFQHITMLQQGIVDNNNKPTQQES